jgi:hypothetical protein
LGAEFAQAVAAGGGGFSSQVVLTGRWMVGPRWGVQAVGVIPLQSQKLEAPEGNAHLAFGLLGAGVHWQPSDDAATPNLGLGIAGLLLATEGDGASGFHGLSSTKLTASPYARAGYGLSFSRSWTLRADLLVGAAMPRPAIAFEDATGGRRTVATWGRPWGALGIGLEFIMN